MKRVLVREQEERTTGLDEESIIEKRAIKIEEVCVWT
jgi:hypothetical protein